MSVIDEIAAERRRQVEVEGWSLDHDDDHTDGSLAWAAACYAAPDVIFVGVPAVVRCRDRAFEHCPGDDEPYATATRYVDAWPASWDDENWKPKDSRRDLIRAAALIVAEIERLDRATSLPERTEEGDG